MLEHLLLEQFYVPENFSKPWLNCLICSFSNIRNKQIQEINSAKHSSWIVLVHETGFLLLSLIWASMPENLSSVILIVKGRLKPLSSATETSLKIKILHVASLYTILSKKQITKALISLRLCVGWSAPLLVANLRRQVFSLRGPYYPVSMVGIDKDT